MGRRQDDLIAAIIAVILVAFALLVLLGICAALVVWLWRGALGL